MAAVVAEHRARGFTAYKIGWGPFGRAMNPALDEAIVRAARGRPGPEASLFVDAGPATRIGRAVSNGRSAPRMLAGLRVGWFEEPLGRMRSSTIWPSGTPAGYRSRAARC